MKRILITGLNSYLGNRIEAYLKQYNQKTGEERYQIEKISLRNGLPENADFGTYDTILHVAGIAHVDISGLTEEERKEYSGLAIKNSVSTVSSSVRFAVACWSSYS